jgi:hypothetical protein
MHVAKLVHMMAERHESGGPGKRGTLIVKDGKAVATWIAPVACYFFAADRPSCGEQVLWREVAARAVLDALGVTPPLRNNRSPYERATVIAEAQRWFRHHERNVEEVFYMAGMKYEPVQRKLLELIQERQIR